MADTASAERVDAVSLREVVRVFGRMGLISFGGPAGQIALMHKVLVDEKRWLGEAQFLHALNYCMLLPGPEAMQLATYAGWLSAGVRGGLIAGLLFLLPGAFAVTLLSAIYLFAGEMPVIAGLFFGLKAAVLAIVLEALLRVAKRALKGPGMILVALSAFVAIALFQVPFPLIVAVAALVGLLRSSSSAQAEVADARLLSSTNSWTEPSWRRFAFTLAIWLAVWFGPLVALHLALPGNALAQAASFFSVMATVTFGGAYAVLTYVAQQAVEVYGWLRADEMLAGLGLAETTPGPLILVLVFVGFLGGARTAGLEPVLGGLAGAMVALWFTFVPCFLWIFVGAPYVERLRNVVWLKDALSAVTAAVVGIIANLALWFAVHVLSAQTRRLTLGPASTDWPVLASFDPAAAFIAAGAAVALLYFKLSILIVLAGAAGLGVLLAL